MAEKKQLMLKPGQAAVLKAAASAPVAAYYRPHGEEEQEGEEEEEGQGGRQAAAGKELQAAVDSSCKQHPPPATFLALSKLQRRVAVADTFRPAAGLELSRRTDFSRLDVDTRQMLETAPRKAAPDEALEELLASGQVEGTVVCDVLSRLHRVRLLTPPGQPARSLVARPEGRRLQASQWMGVYVGLARAAKKVDRSSEYLFDIEGWKVAEAAGGKWDYEGPSLTIDAAKRRNELAYANDVLGAFDEQGGSGKASIAGTVVWDPIARRPHIQYTYIGEKAAEPWQELCISYGDRYWEAAADNMLAHHGALAKRAAQAIAALGVALSKSGVSEAELAATLQLVDLTAEEHRLYRTALE